MKKENNTKKKKNFGLIWVAAWTALLILNIFVSSGMFPNKSSTPIIYVVCVIGLISSGVRWYKEKH